MLFYFLHLNRFGNHRYIIMFHDCLDSMVLWKKKRSPKMPLFWFQDNLGSRPWIRGSPLGLPIANLLDLRKLFQARWANSRVPPAHSSMPRGWTAPRMETRRSPRGFSDGPWIGPGLSAKWTPIACQCCHRCATRWLLHRDLECSCQVCLAALGYPMGPGPMVPQRLEMVRRCYKGKIMLQDVTNYTTESGPTIHDETTVI